MYGESTIVAEHDLDDLIGPARQVRHFSITDRLRIRA